MPLKKRELAELVDLAKRVQAHLKERVHTSEVDKRANADYEAWYIDEEAYEKEINIYAYSRTYRWIASWNRRRTLVAKTLWEELQALGITREMLEIR